MAGERRIDLERETLSTVVVYQGKDPDPPTEAEESGTTPAAGDRELELSRWLRLMYKFRIVTITFNLKPPRSRSIGIWRSSLDDVVTCSWLRRELRALPELKPLLKLLIAKMQA